MVGVGIFMEGSGRPGARPSEELMEAGTSCARGEARVSLSLVGPEVGAGTDAGNAAGG